MLIPEDYYTKAVELEKGAQSQSKSGGGRTIEKIKEETEQAVKNIVAGAIPMDPANPNPKQITVSSYVRIKETTPEIRTSTMETVTALQPMGKCDWSRHLRPVGVVDAQKHDAQERGSPADCIVTRNGNGPLTPRNAPPTSDGRNRVTAPRRRTHAHFE